MLSKITTMAALSVLYFAQAAFAMQSFAGSNNYYLHGLPMSDQETYISTLSGWGAKLVRLWVTGLDGGCVKGSSDLESFGQLESSIGTYDTTVLEKLDATLALLHKYSMKAIISPHDANVIGGANGCDVYCDKYTNQSNFYSSDEAKQDYDNRLAAVFNYNSPNFGKPWSQLNEAIWAFDLQNEPFSNSDARDKLNNNDPDDWLCGRAGVMRNNLGLSADIAVATGGIGGSEICCDREWNLLDKALRCDAIDIMSLHSYLNKASDWAYFINGSASTLAVADAANANNKRPKYVMVEEWGVSTDNTDGFNQQAAVFNDNGVPWSYWQVTFKDQTQPDAPSTCGYDGFEIGLDSSKGDVKDAITAANQATANQTWDGFAL